MTDFTPIDARASSALKSGTLSASALVASVFDANVLFILGERRFIQ